MASFNLPPPPSIGDLDSPEWKKWFFLLTQFAATVTGGTIPIDSGTSGLLPINRLSPDVLAFAAAHG